MIKFVSTLLISWLLTTPALAGDPVVAAKDQFKLLESADPKLAANKRVVFDLFRIVFEAARHDLAPQYMSDNYIQHNPKIPNGREAALETMKNYEQPKPIIDHIRRPLVSIVAEGDLVIMSWVSERPVPDKPNEKYTTTWFDMFRVADGKVVEHWDGMRL